MENVYRDQEDHLSSFRFPVSFFSYWKAKVGRKLTRKGRKKPGKFPFRKTHIQGQVSRSEKPQRAGSGPLRTQPAFSTRSSNL